MRIRAITRPSILATRGSSRCRTAAHNGHSICGCAHEPTTYAIQLALFRRQAVNIKAIPFLLIFGLTTSVAVNAQQNELGWTIDSAVKQLERQGSDFATLLADIEVQWSGDEQGETDAKRGRLYMNKKGDLRINVEAPNTQTIMRVGRTLSYYDPAKATVQEFSLSKHNDRLEVFIPLGFASTEKALTRDFLVTFTGEKDIGTRRTLGLELTPKRDNVRGVVSRIELWVMRRPGFLCDRSYRKRRAVRP